VTDSTERRVLDAVLDLVAETGARELSMSLVAERSEVPVRTIYYRFENRNVLLARAVERLAGELEAEAALDRHDRSAREHLREQVTQLFDAYRGHDHRLAIIVCAAGDPDLARATSGAMRWHRELLGRALAAAATEGTLRLPVREAVAIASAATTVPSWRTLTCNYGLDPDAALQATVTSLDGALFG
jgi:AcrR family transcriptional regulator